MNFFSRFFARPKPRRPYASVDGKTLLDEAQNHFASTIRLYEPADSSNSLWKKTEYGCFLYFWVHAWHERQIPAIRDYRNLLDTLAYRLEEAAPALMLTRINFLKNISPGGGHFGPAENLWQHETFTSTIETHERSLHPPAPGGKGGLNLSLISRRNLPPLQELQILSSLTRCSMVFAMLSSLIRCVYSSYC